MSARRVVALPDDGPTTVPAGGLVAVSGRGPVPPGTPLLAGADTGALHGDGLFETMHVRDARVPLLDEHLSRLRLSAARLHLELPPDGHLADLVGAVVAGWPAGVEGTLRLVCPYGGPVFATVAEIPDSSVRARRDGLAVVTAILPSTRSPADGLKSLSYAENLVQLRRARAAGADDALWVSADGWLLEGPTSSLVWLDGTTLCAVPTGNTGILPGVTATWLLSAWAAGTDHRLVTIDQLRAADGAWLTSSVRGVAAIRTLDGRPLAYDLTRTAGLRSLLESA